MSIYISYETSKKIGIDNYEEIIKDVVNASLESRDCPYEAEINITLCDDEYIKEINDEFRSIQRATDVLSFPAVEFEIPGDFERVIQELEKNDTHYFNPDTGELMLGDMIISVDRVIEQAKEYGHSKKRELAFLTAHSMFHLMGYDHESDTQAKEMEEAQETVLKSLGLTRDIKD